MTASLITLDCHSRDGTYRFTMNIKLFVTEWSVTTRLKFLYLVSFFSKNRNGVISINFFLDSEQAGMTAPASHSRERSDSGINTDSGFAYISLQRGKQAVMTPPGRGRHLSTDSRQEQIRMTGEKYSNLYILSNHSIAPTIAVGPEFS